METVITDIKLFIFLKFSGIFIKCYHKYKYLLFHYKLM